MISTLIVGFTWLILPGIFTSYISYFLLDEMSIPPSENNY